jgi:hypothetical protein
MISGKMHIHTMEMEMEYGKRKVRESPIESIRRKRWMVLDHIVSYRIVSYRNVS